MKRRSRMAGMLHPTLEIQEPWLTARVPRPVKIPVLTYHQCVTFLRWHLEGGGGFNWSSCIYRAGVCWREWSGRRVFSPN